MQILFHVTLIQLHHLISERTENRTNCLVGVYDLSVKDDNLESSRM